MRLLLLLFVPLLLANDAAEPVDLSWLTGDWIMEEDGRVTRENWGATNGAAISAAVRSSPRAAGHPFASMRIASERTGGLTLWATPRGGRAPIPFALDQEHHRMHGNWLFEQRGEDYPQRIIYWRSGGWLFATFMQADGGREQSFTYRLAAPPKPTEDEALPAVKAVEDAVSFARRCIDEDGFTNCGPPHQLHVRNLVCWSYRDVAGYIEPYRSSPAAECSFESRTTPIGPSLFGGATRWRADHARLHHIPVGDCEGPGCSRIWVDPRP